MSSLPTWLNKKTLGTAALCAGSVALILCPAGVITLGLGAVLGYKGKDLIRWHLN